MTFVLDYLDFYHVFLCAICLLWIVSIPISKERLMLCQHYKCNMTTDAASICFDFFLQSFFIFSFMQIQISAIFLQNEAI